MKFGVGDRVQIVLREQTFYSKMYCLTTCKGIVQRDGGGRIYVHFDNSKTTSLAVLRRDLELAKVKGKQLLFDFMECQYD